MSHLLIILSSLAVFLISPISATFGWDAFDPVFFDETTAYEIPENSDTDTSIVTIEADDTEGGTITYSLLSATDDAETDRSAMFNMDVNVLKTTETTIVDYEGDIAYYDVIVKAVTDTVHVVPLTKTIRVGLTNVNEAPVCDPDRIIKNLGDKTAIGSLVYTLSCGDPDADDIALIYAFTYGNTDTYFNIGPTNGVTTVAKQLDRATTSSYVLTVTVTSNSQTESVTLTFKVVADQVPTCTLSDIDKKMTDGDKIGTMVTTLSCEDPEDEPLTFIMLDGNTDNDFATGSSTGKLTVANELDKDKTSSYMLKVGVADAQFTSTVTVNIVVEAKSAVEKLAINVYLIILFIFLNKYIFE